MSLLDRGSRLVLAGGSLLFGVWGLVSPRTLGDAMGATPEEARTIGFRDLGAGLLLFTVKGPGPFALRALYDVGDAIRMRETHPRVALGAAAFAAAGLLQLSRRS